MSASFFLAFLFSVLDFTLFHLFFHSNALFFSTFPLLVLCLHDCLDSSPKISRCSVTSVPSSDSALAGCPGKCLLLFPPHFCVQLEASTEKNSWFFSPSHCGPHNTASQNCYVPDFETGREVVCVYACINVWLGIGI